MDTRFFEAGSFQYPLVALRNLDKSKQGEFNKNPKLFFEREAPPLFQKIKI